MTGLPFLSDGKFNGVFNPGTAFPCCPVSIEVTKKKWSRQKYEDYAFLKKQPFF